MKHREQGLSASMIVRNEARRLPDCIAWLREVADEICVVDTGSEDTTVALARELGCRVLEVPWEDDFSAARNAALAPCSYPWILSVDADEYIAPEDWDAFRALMAGPAECAFRFVTRNYTNDTSATGFRPVSASTPHARGFAGWFPSSKVRLFPNHRDIEFSGIIHELPNPALARAGLPIESCAIPIHHYPLLHATDDGRLAKQALYVRLGQEKVARNPESARAHRELGDQLADMGRYGDAAAAYQAALQIEPDSGETLKNLGAALFILGHPAPAEKATRLAVQIAPQLEEAWRNLGVLLIQRNAFADARHALEQALALNGSHPENLRYLAIACSQSGDRARALHHLEALLVAFPDHQEGRALLQSLRG